MADLGLLWPTGRQGLAGWSVVQVAPSLTGISLNTDQQDITICLLRTPWHLCGMHDGKLAKGRRATASPCCRDWTAEGFPRYLGKAVLVWICSSVVTTLTWHPQSPGFHSQHHTNQAWGTSLQSLCSRDGCKRIRNSGSCWTT